MAITLLGSGLWRNLENSPEALPILDLTLSSPVSLKAPRPLAPTGSPALPKSQALNTDSAKSEESNPAPSENTEVGSDFGEPGVTAIHEVTHFPKVSREIKAVYPAQAKEARIDGPVVLDVVIDAEGVVRQVELVSGPGFGLNESAMAALKEFKFQPAFKDSKAVAVQIRYTYRFKLDVN